MELMARVRTSQCRRSSELFETVCEDVSLGMLEVGFEIYFLKWILRISKLPSNNRFDISHYRVRLDSLISGP